MTEVLDLFPTLTDEQGDMRQTCHRDVDRVLAPFIAANRAREWHMDPTSGWPPRCSKKRTGQGCEPSEFPTAAAACVVGDRPGPHRARLARRGPPPLVPYKARRRTGGA